MSDEPNTRDEPIDPALGALFRAERSNAKPPAGAKARSWAKLEAAVGMPTAAPRPVGPASAVGMPTGGILKLLGALAVGVVLGGAAVSALRPPNVVYVDRPAPAIAASEPAPTVVGMPTVVRAPEPESQPVASSATALSNGPSNGSSGGAGPAPSASSGNLAAERAVLDEARTALGRGDGQHALDATARHQREFPKGQLVEEREAIAIQALTKLQRCDEATARGHRFEQRYTNSVLGPVVDAALSVCANMKSSAPR